MATRANKPYVGKIAYCTNQALGLRDKQGKLLTGGHYVYIRSVKGNKCDVNVVTSLEGKRDSFHQKKISNVAKGYTYPIPRHDATFKLWSGITNNVITVNLSDLQDIGKKSIKRRHHFFVRKFIK